MTSFYWISSLYIRTIFFLVTLLVSISCTGHQGQGTVQELMREAAEQYNDFIVKTPFSAPAAYMETATCEGMYCMFTEAVGYIYSKGYDHEIQAGNFAFLPENMRKSDRIPIWLNTMTNWYADAANISYQSDFRPGYGSLFSSFRWFEMRGPFGDPQSFTFNIVDSTKQADISLLKIDFKSKGSRQESGMLYLDEETLLPYRVVMDSTPFYSDNFRQWVSAENEIIYLIEDNYVSVSVITYRFIKDQIEYWIEMEMHPEIKHYSSIDRRESRALEFITQNPFVLYNENEWPSQLQFSSQNFDQIRTDLEKERSLEKQYESNAGQSYYSRTYKDGRVQTVYEGEQTYDIGNQILERLRKEFK